MIYADYNGSAPICEDVKEYLLNRLNKDGPYANPNAIHYLGNKCLMGMEKARRVCADVLGAQSDQLVFNSGASEGITTVFHSVMERLLGTEKNIIITSGIEHSATVQACKFYANKGAEICVIKTLPNGTVDLRDLKDILGKNQGKVAMVTVMAANNETGVVQPYKEISQLCVKEGVPFFSDTTQFIGKCPFNFAESGMDFAVMSGHKVGALTGTGILMAKDTTKLRPVILGGGQENGLRGGTQNYIGNETLAVALTAFEKNQEKLTELRQRRDNFEERLKKNFSELVIMGEAAPRLSSTSFISLPGVHGQAVQIELESQDIFVTTSSACSDNEPVTSKVLKAMGVTDEVGRGAVRVSLGLCSPLDSYDKIYDALEKAFTKLRRVKSY